MSSFSPRNAKEIKQVLQHCLVCGMIAREITRDMGGNFELAFICGLLHDIGKTILLDMLSDYMLLPDVREKLIDDHHAEVGYLLAQKWNFGDDIKDVIRYHHSPEKAVHHITLAEVISLSNAMADLNNQPEDIRDMTFTSLELSQISVDDLLEQVDRLDHEARHHEYRLIPPGVSSRQLIRPLELPGETEAGENRSYILPPERSKRLSSNVFRTYERSRNRTCAAEEDEIRPTGMRDLRALSGRTWVDNRGHLPQDEISSILNAREQRVSSPPSPVSTKKFIQMYAEAIGIDAGIILAHYQLHVDETQVEPEKVTVVKAQIAFDRKPFSRYLWYAVPAVAIFAAASMYAFLSEKGPLGIFQRNVTVVEQKEVVPKPAPSVKVAPQTPDNTRLNLLVEATEDTWLKITEDRNPPYQIILKRGEKLSRNAKEFFVIDVGNAAGVSITYQQVIGKFGPERAGLHLRLPPQ
jgi:putative nucleotidyltransferase with HDIG domain